MSRMTSTDIPGAGATEQVGLDLAREMRRRWRAGERPAVEEFLAARPELQHQPEAAVELIYEEYCLRQSAGEESVEDDMVRRFPQWAGPLRVMLDCHRRLIQSEHEKPRFPAVGDRVGEFKLTAELVRGSRGRVFLATQSALADRAVVLKITPLDGAEHLSLARLQHTNIVPLYSVVDDAARNIRILCMPYFGRATLASLLESLANVSPDSRTGQHVVDAIDARQQPSAPHPTAIAGAARQMLASVSYEQAMCWITACLADALYFAHERGLVHLDLKPSNVLLATDGQPMLLDFHLAREPIRPACAFPDHFGGTPPYMPHEQRAAIESLRAGGSIDVTVDGRADIYALGAMLYESLGGTLPLTDDSPPLTRVNPHVSAGLSDVVARCLATRQEDRYARASDLADDLRRHLTDQPLAGVANRSFAERWAKWRRRRPATLRTAVAFVLIAGAAAALLASVWLRMSDHHEQAELALFDGRRQLQDGNTSEAVATLERGLGLVAGQPFQRDLSRQLQAQLVSARGRLLVDQLHTLVDEIRVLYGSESIPAERARALGLQCAAFWSKRDALMKLAPDPQLATDLQDLAIFAAHLLGKSPADRDAALRILDEAVAAFGSSAVLEHERAAQGASSGIIYLHDSPRPRTAWEHYALGRSLLASGDLPNATKQLAAALKLEPAGRWPNFYYGLCAYRTGRYDDAVAAYSVCIGTAPDMAGCFYNRALAYAALGRTEQARNDYDRALELDPAHAAAALNRGMLNYQHGRLAQARADLGRALANGADAATVYYDLALVHVSANEPRVALEQVRLALESNPSHEPSRKLRDTLAHNVPK